MTDNEIYIQRLIDEGAYQREHAERAIALILELPDLDLERMIETLIELKQPEAMDAN